jgi:hypothetical protein
MAEIKDKNNKLFAGQKLVYSSKGYSQLLSEYGDDISKSTGALYNSIIFSVDGYILTHGMVLKGAVVDTGDNESGKDGKVSISIANDKKSFTLKNADGDSYTVDLPTVSGDDNVVVSYADGAYSVSLSKDLLGRITTLETSVGTINEEIDAIEKEIDGIDESIASIEGDVTGVSERVDTLETTVGDENSGLVKGLNDVKSNISDIESNISDIEKSISEISGESGKIADLQSQITANKTAVETAQSAADKAQEAAEAAQGTADQNASDIEALDTRVETLEGVVGDANSGLVKDVADNAEAIEVNAKAIAANASDITTIKGNISTINTNIESINGEIDGIKSDVSSLGGRLTAAESNITNITKDGGSIDVKVAAGVKTATDYTDSEVSGLKTTLEATIKDSVKAAEAMRFKGTVASQSELDALTDNTNGDTYKITGDFGSYEVGDMIIWRSTEDGGEWVAVQANIDGAVTTSSDLGVGQIVVGNDTHSVKTISTGNGISVGSDISVKAGSGISVDANGVSVKASTGLEVTDAGVAVKLGATSNAANGVHAVTADSNGNLQVEGVYNTWREIVIDGKSTNANPLEFSETFTMNSDNKVDLAWFEL